MKKLPKKLYIKWNTTADEPWLDATEDLETTADLAQRNRVGVYQLVEEIEVSAPVVSKTIRKVR